VLVANKAAKVADTPMEELRKDSPQIYFLIHNVLELSYHLICASNCILLCFDAEFPSLAFFYATNPLDVALFISGAPRSSRQDLFLRGVKRYFRAVHHPK
jgi:hypothetical protein